MFEIEKKRDRDALTDIDSISLNKSPTFLSENQKDNALFRSSELAFAPVGNMTKVAFILYCISDSS